MTTSDDAADQLIQQLGDLCHEHYLGCAQNKSAPDGFEYSYDTEVICMLETPEAKQLITQHTAFAVQAARIDEARMWRTDSDNRKHVDDRIKQLQADAGRSGETV